ncbi:MAG TPA: hypothetical protein VJ698_03630 [Noviherbaspirillum sp.]|uniref:hypothetical protein n=1 Tax=Noviherbaspirillum sp. TaxID=1926288 RepID=UPI002B465253|nr:hypothetical protein [Noviherbaspirillum sp.]HJV84541.1 hypothetical protein [Noviherbaspirillum sp.]
MQIDYWILAVVAAVGISFGLFLLHEAKRLRQRTADHDTARLADHHAVMGKIRRHIIATVHEHHWSVAQAAARCDMTQRQMRVLLTMPKVSLSPGVLFDAGLALGLRVRIVLDGPTHVTSFTGQGVRARNVDHQNTE